MKQNPRRWAAAALSFALAALAALPALAAPANPRVVGTATQASGISPSVTVTTSGAINGGDLIMVIVAGELNINTTALSQCDFCVTNTGQHRAAELIGPWGQAAQARSRTFVAWAGQDVAAGGFIQISFGGAAGAKAVTVVAVSGADTYGVAPSGTNGGYAAILAQGAGTSIGWACTTNCSIAASLMMVNASIISGGGSDSYTEDAGWTFLHQSAAGAWPAIRVAYKASGAGGTFSYGLTNGSSRSWISGALLVK